MAAIPTKMDIDRVGGAGRARWTALTLGLAGLAFLASPSGPLGGFWRPTAQMAPPEGLQVPLLILLNVAEVLAFGFGVSFLAFGRKAVRRVAGGGGALASAVHLSVAWVLLSWWPHDSLHVHSGLHMNALIAIEYGFHVTLMVSGGILAYFFLEFLRRPASGR